MFTLFIPTKHFFVNPSLASVNFTLFSRKFALVSVHFTGFFFQRNVNSYGKIEVFLVIFILSSEIMHFVCTFAFVKVIFTFLMDFAFLFKVAPFCT